MTLDLASFFPYIIGAFFIAVLFAVVADGSSKSNDAHYDRQESLLSAAEMNFYKHLVIAAPEDCVVFSKVRIADVLKVRKGYNRSRWQTAFNKISAKHFDYVLCDKTSFAVRMTVELDDKSHNTQKAKARDAFVNAACDSARLPLLRVKAANNYDSGDLSEKVAAHLSGSAIS